MDNHKLATRNPFVLYYNAIPIYLHIFTLDGKLLIFFKPKFSIFPGKIFFPWTKSIDFLFLYPFPWDLMVQRIVFSRRPISVERPPDGSHVHAVALAVSLGTGSSPRLLFSLSLSLCTYQPFTGCIRGDLSPRIRGENVHLHIRGRALARG